MEGERGCPLPPGRGLSRVLCHFLEILFKFWFKMGHFCSKGGRGASPSALP